MNATTNPTNTYTVPSVSITTARTGASAKANVLGMRAMQERAYAKRGEQYLLIKSPPASGKSRALIFIALDKLNNQGLRQAIIVVPERSIGGSFADEPLSQYGFYWDWRVAPQWNLCNAPGVDEPRAASRESLQDKEREVNEIMHALGEWKGIDPATGFHQIQTPNRRTLKVADLVDDSDPARRSRVLAALKDPAQKDNRDHVDVIIALGMAKEGFDWIWCEHALTIGYRSSLTEIVQIIGRATRDAGGKERARFTNLIAEPAAEQSAVAEAVNDMLKAISASLLMEQVLAPRYEFTPKDMGPKEGFDYGPDGYQPGRTNVGVNEGTGQYHVEINGLATPETSEATRICKEDLNEVVTSFLQDKTVLERGLFD